MLGAFPEEILRACRHRGEPRRGKNAPPISPLVLEAVKRIDVLFDIERGINGESAEHRLSVRKELSAPVLADLKDWMQAERRKLSHHSPVAKAMDYTSEPMKSPS